MTKAEEREFHDFVSARMDRWRRSAYLMCQNWHTADDVVAVTITQVFRKWREVRSAENPDAFAQRVLTHTWLSERRRPWRRERATDRLPDAAEMAPDRITDRQSLARMLKALGPRQRAVLVLRFYLDYSVEETAALLHVSTGTVKSQTARGLHALREVAQSPFG